ncbi:MAG: ABC transporter ATP-binding protein [Deltaproteobacteria bacterium]|nr:ABC transporter ATP-binding protein [Deltaproteobacteria bacterium]
MERNIVLQVNNVSFAYERALVLKNIAFSIRQGEFMALIGPNGSGKTTLLKIILGTLIAREGEIWLDGKPVLSYPPKERAKKMSYVSQQAVAGFPLTVEELVSLGRYPHEERFGRKPGEPQAVEDALRLTDSLPLKERKFTALSGGEKQKVLIARALAQTSYLLLLDEPTVHLDLYFQLQVLNSLKRLCAEGKSTVVAVMHDLNLISLFADKVLLLKSGEALAFGKVSEVLNEGSMEEAFGVKVAVTEDSQTGAVYYLPRKPPP